jgi:hypothetical protein
MHNLRHRGTSPASFQFSREQRLAVSKNRECCCSLVRTGFPGMAVQELLASMCKDIWATVKIVDSLSL